jgi:hypothetical protein
LVIIPLCSSAVDISIAIRVIRIILRASYIFLPSEWRIAITATPIIIGIVLRTPYIFSPSEWWVIIAATPIIVRIVLRTTHISLPSEWRVIISATTVIVVDIPIAGIAIFPSHTAIIPSER